MTLPISPSSFARVFACPGSARLSEGINTPSNAAMERGTKLHAELEALFTAKKKVTAKTPATLKVALGGLLRARADLAGVALNPVTEYVEARLDFKWLGIELGEERGRVDYAFVNEHSGIVIDFKTGRGSDEYDRPRESWQLRLYAAALALKHPEVETWGLAYCAPERESGEVWTEAWVDADELAEVREMAVDAVKRAQAEDAPTILGDHCKWCPAKSKCPSMGASLPSIGNDTLVGVSAADKFVAMAPTDRAELWSKVLAAEEWLGALKADITRLAHEGHEVEGYEAKPYRIDKRWADEETAAKVLTVAFGEGAFERRLISPAAALKKGLVDDCQLIAEVPAAITLKKRGKR